MSESSSSRQLASQLASDADWKALACEQLAPTTMDWVDYYESAPGVVEAVDGLIQELAWEPPGTNVETAIYNYVVDIARSNRVELINNKLNEQNKKGSYIWNIWLCTEKGLS